MSLPKGYKRLEYIQSSGTQHIDSGFIPNQDTRVVCKAQYTDTSGSEALLGSRYSTSKDRYDFVMHGGAFYSVYNNNTGTTTATATATASVMVIDKNKNITSIDGVVFSTQTYASFQCPGNLLLFANNTNNTPGLQASATIYSCQIYDNGTLVRDFIPCQNADGAVGLWDDANGVFYGNAGTGTFTAGPVVPEIVDESEITELEYIQSSGTQYVNTVFFPSESSRISFDFQSTGSTSDSIKAMFGARLNNDTKCFDMFVLPATAYPQYGANAYNAKPISANILQRTVYEMNRNTATVNGVSVSFAAETFDTGFPVYLFTLNDNGIADARPISGKLYACQIYDNGLLERDYVPAMLANGEVGLYDRVFHEFYRNAGTGEFIAGPEMVHEGYTELEYIQSDGAQELHTGVCPSSDLNAEITLKPFVSGMAENAILGAAWSLNGFFLMFYQNMLRFHSSGASVDVSDFDKTGKNNLKCSPKQFVVNGQPHALSGTGSDVQQEIVLFYVKDLAGNNFNPPKRGVYALYSCRFDTGSNPVRVYIPMLHPSGVAGLWDSVNERFYASSTTTDLIAGPEAQTVPKAPANFRVESEDGTLVTLAWDTSEKAVGYRLYRSGQLLADTTETSVSVAVEPFAGAVFTLTAYNENGEGAGSTLTYFKAPEDPILYLITDRTQQDVAERNTKGYYAASDLNRVGFAVKYLAGRLKDSGVSVTVSPVLTWTDEEWATPSAMTAYLKDVQTMRNALKVAETTPTAPEDMARLTYSEANDIESILVALDAHITRMLSIVDTGWASGLAYTGFYAKEAY